MTPIGKKKPVKSAKEPKDVRYIRKLFGAEHRTFDTRRAGFVPFPIVYRKLFRKITPPQLRVLLYLCTRMSRYGLCYPTYEEIAHDLGLEGRRNLTPHIKALEESKFISTRTAEGKKFYLVHDPVVAIEHLCQTGRLSANELDEINDLLETLKQPEISTVHLRARPPKGVKTPSRP